jgi:hypothetical protein
MTTFAYDITLNDSEVIMLKAALEIMIEHCEAKIAVGEGAPFFAHKISTQSDLTRLHANATQPSGNNFS